MTTRDVGPYEPHARQRREAGRLVRQIQTLFRELEELRRHEHRTPQIQAKEHRLEQLRWRLAAVARRSASDDLDAAA
jgi:hypothetical protein